MTDPAVLDRSRERLGAVRRSLLHLHKALVDSERLTFERVQGRISSNGELLQLVLHDPWFVWLRPVSALVVEIDELLDSDAGPSEQDVRDIIEHARALLTPAEEGNAFATNYYEALQRDPGVVMAHAGVSKVLGQDA